MKRFLIFAVAIVVSLSCLAASAKDNWLTDPEKAIASAKGTSKMVLMDFTGSDWCPPCILLHRDVFSQPEFEKFAKDNLVLVRIDFPRGKPQTEEELERNMAVAKKYQVLGFPTIIVLNSDGKQIGRLGYMPGGPTDFIDALKKLPTS